MAHWFFFRKAESGGTDFVRLHISLDTTPPECTQASHTDSTLPRDNKTSHKPYKDKIEKANTHRESTPTRQHSRGEDVEDERAGVVLLVGERDAHVLDVLEELRGLPHQLKNAPSWGC